MARKKRKQRQVYRAGRRSRKSSPVKTAVGLAAVGVGAAIAINALKNT